MATSVDKKLKRVKIKKESQKVKIQAGESKVYKKYNFKPWRSVRKRMDSIWLSKDNNKMSNEEFWKRQWLTHGVISRMGCTRYFAKTLAAAEKIKVGLQEAIKKLKLPKGALVEKNVLVNAIKEEVGFEPWIHLEDVTHQNRPRTIKDVRFLFGTDFKPRKFPVDPDDQGGKVMV